MFRPIKNLDACYRPLHRADHADNQFLKHPRMDARLGNGISCHEAMCTGRLKDGAGIYGLPMGL